MRESSGVDIFQLWTCVQGKVGGDLSRWFSHWSGVPYCIPSACLSCVCVAIGVSSGEIGGADSRAYFRFGHSHPASNVPLRTREFTAGPGANRDGDGAKSGGKV